LKAAALLCAIAGGSSMAVNADEGPAKPAGNDASAEPVLNLQDAAITLNLGQDLTQAADGRTFAVGHSTEEGWHARVASGNPRTPDADSGVVVVGSGSGASVYGYDAATGKHKWTANSKDAGISSILIGLGRAYYTTYSCTLESVRVADGRQMYSKYLAPTVDCGPALQDELVAAAYQKGGGWQVSMHNAVQGSTKWGSDVGSQSVLTAPVLMDGAVFIAQSDGKLTRLAGNKGTKEWTADFGAVSAPVPTPWGLMVTTTWDGRADSGVRASDKPATEAERKQRERETVRGEAGITGTIIAASDRRVAMLSDLAAKPEGKVGKQDAGPRGTLDFQGLRPGVSSRHIFLAYGDTITAVDPALGLARWSIKLAKGQGSFVRPVAHRGLVLVATSTGLVGAIEEDTGSLVWAYRVKNASFVAEPAAEEDRMFITTTAGQLISLPLGTQDFVPGKSRVEGPAVEGVASTYWKAQETFRRVRDIMRDMETPETKDAETGKSAESGEGPGGTGPGGVAPEDEAARPREDAETEVLTKGQQERRDARKAERGTPNGREVENKEADKKLAR